MSSETEVLPVPRDVAPRAEHPVVPRRSKDGPRPIGRLRLPLDLHHQPWATLYRFPDGRLEWCVRLWQLDRPVRSIVSTRVLRRYALSNGLRELSKEIDLLVEEACRGVDLASS
jgi:hypothetical protein